MAAIVATEVVDVTEWIEIQDLMAPGTRDKVWIYDPESKRRALFKQPKAGTCEHICEKLTVAIAGKVGLAVPQVFCARRGEFLGTVIYSFLGDGERLVHGGEVFAEVFEGFDQWDFRAHTYQRLRRVMFLPANRLRLHEMVLLDALVGNVDRHVNNWGFVSNSVQYFAPLFDNGSTLIARCGPEKCEHLLRDGMQFDGLVRNCDSRIYWEPDGVPKKLRHFEFISQVRDAYPKDLQAVEGRFKDTPVPALIDCLSDVPEGWLTQAQIDVAERLIRTRHRALLECLE